MGPREAILLRCLTPIVASVVIPFGLSGCFLRPDAMSIYNNSARDTVTVSVIRHNERLYRDVGPQDVVTIIGARDQSPNTIELRGGSPCRQLATIVTWPRHGAMIVVDPDLTVSVSPEQSDVEDHASGWTDTPVCP
jgi:hypothetical protein